MLKGGRVSGQGGDSVEAAGGSWVFEGQRGTLRVSNIGIFTCLITFFSRNSLRSNSAPEKRACENTNARNSKQPS